MQTEILKSNHPSSLNLIRNIYNNGGILGFYKGIITTQLNNIKFAIQFRYMELDISLYYKFKEIQ